MHDATEGRDRSFAERPPPQRDLTENGSRPAQQTLVQPGDFSAQGAQTE